MTVPLKKILLAEDEPDIQRVVEFALKDIGNFELKICNSGIEALKAAPEYNPDLILLDVMMPEMDGPTTLLNLRKNPATMSTPVVFMTAKVQTNEVLHYKKLGATDVIMKPFDPMSLASVINEIWERIHG
ncbi:MAG: response regulator [Candidatus Gastranaerophilales bacterium]|nr:response regulator [Candidatus Gastranaerophilales bacterium]